MFMKNLSESFLAMIVLSTICGCSSSFDLGSTVCDEGFRRPGMTQGERPHFELLEKLYNAANTSDGEVLFSLLPNRFSAAKRLLNDSWRLKCLNVVSVRGMEGFYYMQYTSVEIIENREFSGEGVFLLSVDKHGKLALVNFPFFRSGIPEFMTSLRIHEH